MKAARGRIFYDIDEEIARRCTLQDGQSFVDDVLCTYLRTSVGETEKNYKVSRNYANNRLFASRLW